MVTSVGILIVFIGIALLSLVNIYQQEL